MIALLWAVPKYVFYLVLAGVAVVFAFNYTPFFRPPGVDAAMLNADRLENSYGQQYLRRRGRFMVRVTVALARAYAFQAAMYAILPRLFPDSVPTEYRSNPPKQSGN